MLVIALVVVVFFGNLVVNHEMIRHYRGRLLCWKLPQCFSCGSWQTNVQYGTNRVPMMHSDVQTLHTVSICVCVSLLEWECVSVPLSFQADVAGRYRCRLVLRSWLDTRVYQLEMMVTAQVEKKTAQEVMSSRLCL